MENKFFLHQIKRTSGTIDKGIVVKDSYEAAKQGYHAYRDHRYLRRTPYERDVGQV